MTISIYTSSDYFTLQPLDFNETIQKQELKNLICNQNLRKLFEPIN